jgi:hypothetical protein
MPFVFSDALPQSFNNPALRVLLLTTLSLVHIHEFRVARIAVAKRHLSRTKQPSTCVVRYRLEKSLPRGTRRLSLRLF